MRLALLALASCATPTLDGTLVTGDITMPGTPLADVSIYTVRADGTQNTVLTGAGNQYPSWTPDGRIVFVSNRSGSPQIWIMDADGTNAAQLGDISSLDPITEIGRVQMASTGLVAFKNTGDGIWLMEADGSNLRELVKFDNGAGDAPSLALLGTWLTFTALATATPGHNEIFRIDTDGTHREQLTFATDADYPDGNASSISPDETQVAIYTGIESRQGDTPLTWGHRNIGLVGPHGGARTLLTACEPVTTQDALDHMTPEQCLTSDNPSWAPDGNWIIYARGSNNPAGAGTYAVEVATKAIHRVDAAFTDGGSVPFR